MKKYKERKILNFKLGISADEAAEYFAADVRRVLDEARAQQARDDAAAAHFKEYLKSKVRW